MKAMLLPTKRIGVVLSAVLVLAAGVASAASLPLTRQFGAWQASCSAIEQACAAWVFSEEGGATLTLRRSSVPDGNWEVHLFPSSSKAQDAKTIQMVVGSKHISAQAGRDWRPGPLPGEIVLITREPANEVLAAMIAGASLDLAVGGPGTTASDHFSLSGVSAALLWVDEVQGRVAAPRVAQAPANLPDVSAAVRQAQRHFSDEAVTARLDTLPAAVLALRRGDTTCDPLDLKTGDEGQGYGVQWLSADTAMFTVACTPTPREPINRYILSVAPEFSDARILDFQTWDGSLSPPGPSRTRGRDVPWLMADPVFSRLVASQIDNHGGLTQTWRWDGRKAHLIEVDQMQRQGQSEGPWSVLWRAAAAQL